MIIYNRGDKLITEKDRLDKVGTTFGKLSIISYKDKTYEMICDCGTTLSKKALVFETYPNRMCKTCAKEMRAKDVEAKEEHFIIRDYTMEETSMIRNWLKSNKIKRIK